MLCVGPGDGRRARRADQRDPILRHEALSPVIGWALAEARPKEPIPVGFRA